MADRSHRLAGVKECLCECDRLRLDSERIWVDDAARQVQRVEILRFASSRVTSTGISSSQFVKFQLRTLELLGDTMNVTAPASLRASRGRVSSTFSKPSVTSIATFSLLRMSRAIVYLLNFDHRSHFLRFAAKGDSVREMGATHGCASAAACLSDTAVGWLRYALGRRVLRLAVASAH